MAEPRKFLIMNFLRDFVGCSEAGTNDELPSGTGTVPHGAAAHFAVLALVPVVGESIVR